MGKVCFDLVHRLRFHLLAFKIIVIAEEPDSRKYLEGGTLTWYPWTNLPYDRQADPPVLTVLANIDRACIVVLSNRNSEAGHNIDGETRFIPEHVRNIHNGFWPDHIDAELHHRISESASCCIVV